MSVANTGGGEGGGRSRLCWVETALGGWRCAGCSSVKDDDLPGRSPPHRRRPPLLYARTAVSLLCGRRGRDDPATSRQLPSTHLAAAAPLPTGPPSPLTAYCRAKPSARPSTHPPSRMASVRSHHGTPSAPPPRLTPPFPTLPITSPASHRHQPSPPCQSPVLDGSQVVQEGRPWAWGTPFIPLSLAPSPSSPYLVAAIALSIDPLHRVASWSGAARLWWPRTTSVPGTG